MAKTDEGFAMRYVIGKTSGEDAFSFKKANKIKTKWWRPKHLDCFESRAAAGLFERLV